MNIKAFRETTKFILFNIVWQDRLKYNAMWLNLMLFIFLLA